MKLALRSTPASDARWYEIAFNLLTKWRLVSRYAHGGVIIGDRLFQSNGRHGLHVSDFNPANWDIFDLGPERDSLALAMFEALEGARYDYLGVLGFGLPLPRSRRRFYCFSWCAAAMGLRPKRWMTPERLLLACLRDRDNKMALS